MSGIRWKLENIYGKNILFPVNFRKERTTNLNQRQIFRKNNYFENKSSLLEPDRKFKFKISLLTGNIPKFFFVHSNEWFSHQ